MTLTQDAARLFDLHPGCASAWRPRTELDVIAQQLGALQAFAEARHAHGSAGGGSSREQRMDAARNAAVLQREHDAVVARAQQQLAATGRSPLHELADRRVVLACRDEWFAGTLHVALADAGVRVVARLDNGADAVGHTLAEQPDLLLVEDALAMLPGELVVREVRRFAPDTVLVARVAQGDRVGVLLDAGASTVFTRQLPPHAVAQSLLELLGGGDVPAAPLQEA
ncbi:MAG: hypothetical protein M3P46_03795 [Actinomycetota bacterium]|nr:hypothetical protein [Actinomycetota bacterium]